VRCFLIVCHYNNCGLLVVAILLITCHYSDYQR
jgi:hypothetical protein